MRKQKGFIKMLLIIIAVIVVAVFVYMRMSSRTEIIPSNITDNKTSSSLQSSEKDITVDWRTYKNDKYGFELKYPLKWGNINISSSVPTRELEYDGHKSFVPPETIFGNGYGYDTIITFDNNDNVEIIIVDIDSINPVFSHYTPYDGSNGKFITLAEEARRLKSLPDGILSKWDSGHLVELKTLSANKLRAITFPSETMNGSGRSHKFYGKDFAYQLNSSMGIYFPPGAEDEEAELVLSTFKFTK